MANNIQIKDGNDVLVTVATLDTAGVHRQKFVPQVPDGSGAFVDAPGGNVAGLYQQPVSLGTKVAEGTVSFVTADAAGAVKTFAFTLPIPLPKGGDFTFVVTNVSAVYDLTVAVYGIATINGTSTKFEMESWTVPKNQPANEGIGWPVTGLVGTTGEVRLTAVQDPTAASTSHAIAVFAR